MFKTDKLIDQSIYETNDVICMDVFTNTSVGIEDGPIYNSNLSF